MQRVPFAQLSLCALACACFLGVSLFPFLSFAQTSLFLETFQADLTLRSTPQFPAPGQTVRFSVQSSLFDLPSSEISWYVNNELAAQGVGRSDVDIAAGPLGSETFVRVEVRREGASATASGVIRPTSVDLLWEGDTYVPPFYQGRALPSAGGSVRLYAVPHFQSAGANAPIDPSELFYTWKKDGRTLTSLSGKGRYSVMIDGPVLFGTDIVSVEVKTADGVLQGSASVRLASVEPSLVLYEEHPIFGVLFHRAVENGATFPETEVGFVAIPYYAPVQNLQTQLLAYNWRVNGSSVSSNQARPNTITLNAAGSDGRATLELTLTHATNFFLRVAKSWNVALSAKGVGQGNDPFGSSTR